MFGIGWLEFLLIAIVAIVVVPPKDLPRLMRAFGHYSSIGLVVLALAQIGVYLVFFLHLGSGPDSTNNILALAFGVLIVFLVIIGSVWIIANLNSNMMPMLAQ